MNSISESDILFHRTVGWKSFEYRPVLSNEQCIECSSNDHANNCYPNSVVF